MNNLVNIFQLTDSTTEKILNEGVKKKHVKQGLIV